MALVAIVVAIIVGVIVWRRRQGRQRPPTTADAEVQATADAEVQATGGTPGGLALVPVNPGENHYGNVKNWSRTRIAFQIFSVNAESGLDL